MGNTHPYWTYLDRLLDAEVRERLSVSKRAEQKYNKEIFNLNKLNDVEAKEV
jgi:hypothetical protein